MRSASSAIARSSDQGTSRSTSGSWTPTLSGLFIGSDCASCPGRPPQCSSEQYSRGNAVQRRYGFAVAESDPLAGQPFSYLTRADGTILIRYHEAPVTILRGKAALRFAARLEGADATVAQRLMARATGNFTRGNERDGKRAAR